MQEGLDQATDPWGVLVERVEVKDVRVPENLQRAMAAEAEAAREGRAKVAKRIRILMVMIRIVMVMVRMVMMVTMVMVVAL